MPEIAPAGILVEAGSFDHPGGWTFDSQFAAQMGAPYLLAHGLGRPVADATTTFVVATADTYNVWVRAKDWVPEHHPGRFRVVINETTLQPEFGANGRDWSWQSGGRIELHAGENDLRVVDLTGFDGRLDAVFLTMSDAEPPNGAGPDALAWRRRLREQPDQPSDASHFDVVVVGGGIAGSTAALTAARLGRRVALIQDRPVLGGNASIEIGLNPRGERGPLVDELAARIDGGDLQALHALRAEPTATVVLEHAVFDVVMNGDWIVAVDARDARTGRESRFSAPVFIDCTGTAILGILSGAETLFGQEGKGEYGERLAPEVGDDMHHGNTVFFRTRMAEEPVPFPDVPWAVEIAKDFASLNGQLERPGVENGPGPGAGEYKAPNPDLPRRMLLPATHFWEYGQWLDPYTEGEHIRDHLLRAIYGTFANVKRLEPETYANLELEWVAFVPGQGEFRRYRGDHVLTETEIREHVEFPDAVAQNSGAFCLHYAGNEEHDFRLKDWRWDTRGDDGPYDVPFRCLYSVNIPNLMMAGKHISVTHVAGSSTKMMGNGGQHAVATAAAAHLCVTYGTTPRGIHDDHIDELKDLVARIPAELARKANP